MPDASRTPAATAPERRDARVGRYLLFETFAAGGMASVCFGRMLGALGTWRTVAIKQMHSHYVQDNQAVAMFVDEARLTSRLVHPNVVPTIDVVLADGALLIVMEYIEGESLARLLSSARKLGKPPPPSLVSAIMLGVLAGLHAAHELRDDRNGPLGVVHRDVSPQNILVGIDGVARVIDFGIAKAEGRLQDLTSDLQLKGKASYMAPEQALRKTVDRRADIFAAAVVLWEGLAGRRLFNAENIIATLRAVAEDPVPPLASLVDGQLAAVDTVLARGLAREREQRFATAKEFAEHLEQALAPAPSAEVARWVSLVAGEAMARRAELRSRVEREQLDVGIVSVGEGVAALGRGASPESNEDATITLGGRSERAGEPRGAPPKPVRSRRRALGLLATAAAATAALGWVVSGRVNPPPLKPSGAGVLLSASAATRVVVPDPRASEPRLATSLHNGPAVPAFPEPSSRSPSKGRARVPKRIQNAKPASAPAGPVKESRPDCAVPWVFSGQGVRIPKPGCFPE